MLDRMNTNTNTTTISNVPTEPRRVFVRRSPGVDISLLRAHADGGVTVLVRMEKGARAERHGHPGGEETYILSGQLRIDRRIGADDGPLPDVLLRAGDHAFIEPGESHEGVAEENTTFFVVAPGGIVPAKTARRAQP
jgi:quercetin dioxygenase-like cupin family protein